MRLRALVLAGAMALWSGELQADVLQLKNGRRVVGEILQRSEGKLVVLVKGGGRMVFPESLVTRIDSREEAEAEFEQRAGDVDMSDPRAVQELSAWATERGLIQRGRELAEQALALSLELRIVRAREQDSAEGFVQAYHWARAQGFADEVQLWLLAEATSRDGKSPALAQARLRYKRDKQLEARRAAQLEEIKRRPRYKMPSEEEQVLLDGELELKAARNEWLKKRERARRLWARLRALLEQRKQQR